MAAATVTEAVTKVTATTAAAVAATKAVTQVGSRVWATRAPRSCALLRTT